MSTITKEQVIQATLSNTVDIDIIIEYCNEVGGDSEAIQELIPVIIYFSDLLDYCYSVALDYFHRKYEVVLCYSKKGKLITAY